jgi:hypothetical protein
VNPPGEDFGRETVTLKNMTDEPVVLKDWVLVDKNRRYETISDITLDKGASVVIHLSGLGAQLSNNGGTLTLLNGKSIKIDGIAYTQKQVSRHAGKLLQF